MQKIHFVIFVYISSVCFARDISEQYNRISENTSQGADLMEGRMRSTEESWQPMSHGNWIVLNPAIQKEPTTSAKVSSNHRNNVYSRNPHHLLAPLNGDSYTQKNVDFQERQQYQWDKKQQEQPQGLSINYYTYNHSSGGNYRHPTTADVKLIEPYFVTISKMKSRKEPNSKALHMRSVSQGAVGGAASSFGAAITLPKDVVGSVVSLQKEWRQDVSSNVSPGNKLWSKSGGSIDITATSAPDENNDEADSVFDEIATDGENLNEIFQPLRRTLDKVIQVCDMAKRLITSEDDETDNDIEGKENPNDNDNDLNNENRASGMNTAIHAAPARVQGYRSISPKPTMLSLMGTSSQHTGRSRAKTTQETMVGLSSVGTGRKVKKLKKKFRKFLLPLLLAYKLKFLTLIPVFIGGLTLLVGTTGLAGFFFALFTAVMSLKSTGGSKSIIVKKI